MTFFFFFFVVRWDWSELRHCVKVEVAVLGFPVLTIVRTVSVDLKRQLLNLLRQEHRLVG